MKNDPLVTASIAALATATGPYRIQVGGNALAPKFRDGEFVAISPAVDMPEAIRPGRLVLVALPSPRILNAYDRAALYIANADGDLIAGKETVQKGHYVLLGVQMEVPNGYPN